MLANTTVCNLFQMKCTFFSFIISVYLQVTGLISFVAVSLNLSNKSQDFMKRISFIDKYCDSSMMGNLSWRIQLVGLVSHRFGSHTSKLTDIVSGSMWKHLELAASNHRVPPSPLNTTPRGLWARSQRSEVQWEGWASGWSPGLPETNPAAKTRDGQHHQ